MKFKNKQHKENYNRKMKRIRKIKKYHERLDLAAEANRKEKLDNLKRMYGKGLISDQAPPSVLSTFFHFDYY